MIIIGEINLGARDVAYFKQQIEFLKSLRTHDGRIIFLGSIFKNKKIQLDMLNEFVGVLKKFDEVYIVCKSQSDKYLEFLHNCNGINIVTTPMMIDNNIIIPKCYSPQEQANAYKFMNEHKPITAIVNDMTSKYKLDYKINIISSENAPNVQTCVITFDENCDETELFALNTNDNSRIMNGQHPKNITLYMEDVASFTVEEIQGNIVNLTTKKTYKDIYARNKFILNIQKILKTQFAALKVNIHIQEIDKIKLNDITDINSFVNNLCIENDKKVDIINELQHKLKDIL